PRFSRKLHLQPKGPITQRPATRNGDRGLCIPIPNWGEEPSWDVCRFVVFTHWSFARWYSPAKLRPSETKLLGELPNRQDGDRGDASPLCCFSCLPSSRRLQWCRTRQAARRQRAHISLSLSQAVPRRGVLDWGVKSVGELCG